MPARRAGQPGAGGEELPAPAARRPVTMKDIAAATGVSRSTVSRILSDAPLAIPIAAETRQRVLAVSRQLGYRPNPLARALRGAPTMLLGAIVRDITDPFFAGAIEALSVEARSRGYNIVLGHAHAEATEAFALATVLEARHCDAILLLGDMGDQPRLLEDLRSTHALVVALWQGSQRDPIPGISVDNHAGIGLAMDHLRGLGHRRIAFVSGRLLGDIRERQLAYTQAITRTLGEVPPGYLHQTASNTPTDGEAAFAALRRLSPRPTAVVAATDVLAIGLLRGALVAGVRVPEQLSVVGFDDITMAGFTVPALTTVRMPTARMAAAAIELAVGEPGRPAPGGAPSLQFQPDLAIRDSTTACPDR